MVIVFGTLTFCAVKYVLNKPPLAEIDLARKTLGSVKKELVGKYANEKLKEAEDLFNQAMKEWNTQNDVFFVFRDYSSVREMALKSAEIADMAKEEAKSVKEKLTQNIEYKLNKCSISIEHYEQYYKNIPVGRSTINLYNRGKIKYFEAQHEYEHGEIKQALKIISKASEDLSQAEKAAYFKLREFYKSYPEWEKNYELAFALSKKGQTVVLIDKLQSSCTLLKSGKEYKTFSAEFGFNWLGDKIMSGDGATPEGIYKIVEKKKVPKTKYYKALLLDYPNKSDRVRFNQLIQDGKLNKNATIGGLIEIHGDGDKGIHWTDGCIALADKDMDIVFEQCKVNTQVIIIGSKQPLEEYLN
jgi:L,D-peptidoglycan transpeptidase YkuD (ErfK/YbiS/YcfS/YnhG family)